MSDKRIRDFGITIGELPTGRRNAITDVRGVRVGHCTLAEGECQTGVTVVMPCEGNIFAHKLPAACFVLNGFGKSQGLVQIDELGSLETPIALTNTLNVGLVHDALVEYMLERCAKDGVPLYSVNPVVCECNDSELNRIALRSVKREHVFTAMEAAGEDFEQGAVGGGRGMVCYGMKGGIGSSSRMVGLDGKEYTVGVLVQANHGRTVDLTVAGRNIGRAIAEGGAKLPPVVPSEQDRGSIIMLVATDIPATDRQLKRIIKRCAAGLARTGSYFGHGSGDIMLGFSTAYALPASGDADIVNIPMLNENRIERAFRACAEACEEAILNALAAADTVTGADGHTRYAAAPWFEALLK